MFTLLAEQQKRFLFRQYRLRLLAVCLFLIALLAFVADLLLLPSNLMFQIKRDELTFEDKYYSKVIATENSKGLISTLEDIKSMVFLAPPSDNNLYEVMAKVMAHRSSGIRINSWSYVHGVGADSSLAIKGVADSREELLTFWRSLQKESFSRVDLPIASLAKESNAPFSLSILGKF